MDSSVLSRGAHVSSSIQCTCFGELRLCTDPQQKKSQNVTDILTKSDYILSMIGNFLQKVSQEEYHRFLQKCWVD